MALNNYQAERRNVKGDPFGNLEDPNVQYWLGFLAADGSVWGNRLALPIKDYDHLLKSKDFLGHTGSIKEVTKGKYKWYALYFKNKVIVDKIKALGIVQNKTFTLDYNGPITKDFLRGFIDGDGWIMFHKRSYGGWCKQIGYCSASIKMMKKLDNFLMSNNISITKADYKNIYSTKVNKNSELEKLINLIYNDAHTYLTRKYDNAQKIREYLQYRSETQGTSVRNPEANQQIEENLIEEKM